MHKCFNSPLQYHDCSDESKNPADQQVMGVVANSLKTGVASNLAD